MIRRETGNGEGWKPMATREFTVKTAVTGLISLLIVCAFPPYSDLVLKIPKAIEGYLPVVPLFLMVMMSCAWNMIAGRFNRSFALTGRELAVIFCFMLMVSWIPGLQGSLVRHLILPRYEEMTSNVPWKEAGVTSRLPSALFPAGESGAPIGEKVHFGFIQGGLTVGKIPFAEWVLPLLHWIPLLIVLCLCLLALTFLVHRQWAFHEQLRYPLASVADALLRQDDTRPGGRIFHNKLFWWGFLMVFFLHLLGYLDMWFPGKLPQPALSSDLNWAKVFPIIGTDQSNASMFVLHWMPISFAIIGIAYFVPSDVSLAVGLTAPLGTLIGIQYYLATGVPLASSDLDIFRSGGFIAFGLILMYTGRTYYFPLLWRAIIPVSRKVLLDPGEVWAARVFLAGYICLIVIFKVIGFDFLIAWIYVTFLLLVFLVVTRLVCETGVPTITPSWSLPGLMTGLFGPAAIGAVPLVFMSLLSRTMADSTQLIMPYMATSLKILDDNKIKLRRFAYASIGVIAIMLVAGFIAILTISYTNGQGNLSNEERAVLQKGASEVLNLKDLGKMEVSEAARGFDRLPLMQADGRTVGWVMAGLALVLVTYGLRFRFAKWPIHPLFLILLGTTVGMLSWFGFLLGWGIKNLVVKFGGGGMYNSMKPLFIGFIVGELMTLAIGFVVGFIYFQVTGATPPVAH